MLTTMFSLLILFSVITLIAVVLGLLLMGIHALAKAAFSSLVRSSSADYMTQSEARRAAEVHRFGTQIRRDLEQLSFDYLDSI